MAKSNPYYEVIVESFIPKDSVGRHGEIHIRPVKGERYSQDLFVECSKSLSDTNKYPVGTKFKIKAKLTDRDGGGEFLYSYYNWKPQVIK